MELLYIWINQYKNIHQQGFNFSAEYDIEFEFKLGAESQLFTIKPKPEAYVEHFWDTGDKISNITAIVGENGTGKSSLLWFIMNYFDNQILSEYDDGVLLLYKKGQQIFYAHSDKIKVDNFSDSFNPRQDNSKSSVAIKSEKNKFDNLMVSYDHIFSPFRFQEIARSLSSSSSSNSNLENLSVSAMLLKDANLVDTTDLGGAGLHIAVGKHTLEERIREIQTIYGINQGADQLIKLVNLPQFLVWRLKRFDKRASGDMMDKFSKPLINQPSDRLIDIAEECSPFNKATGSYQNMVTEYWESIFYHFIRGWDVFLVDKYKKSKSTIKNDWLYKILVKNLNDLKQAESIFIKDVEKFFDDVKQDLTSETDSLAKQITDEIDSIRALVGNENEPFSITGYWKKEYDPSVHGRPGTNSMKFDVKENPEKLIAAMQRYYKSFSRLGYLDFVWAPDKWGEYYFSSGEQTMLSLFSRFWSFFGSEDFQRRIKDLSGVLILIDEGELTLHPQWQKQFVYNLIELVKHLPNLEGKKVQIILTTHSPLILSDFLAENVIFLRKLTEEDVKQAPKQRVGNCMVVNREDKQTFGANVHSLLADSFFLQGGLVGEFAKQKLQDVWDYINFNENAKDTHTEEEQARYNELVSKGWGKDKAWRIIKKIGEPFVKSSFEDKYFEKFPDDELKRLRARVKMLEAKEKQNDTNKTK